MSRIKKLLYLIISFLSFTFSVPILFVLSLYALIRYNDINVKESDCPYDKIIKFGFDYMSALINILNKLERKLL